MPEPAGSPSDPSPTSSQFFDAKAITAQLASSQSVEEGTLNSSEQIAENTRGLFDFVKDDISKSIEKISSGAKISRRRFGHQRKQNRKSLWKYCVNDYIC